MLIKLSCSEVLARNLKGKPHLIWCFLESKQAGKMWVIRRLVRLFRRLQEVANQRNNTWMPLNNTFVMILMEPNKPKPSHIFNQERAYYNCNITYQKTNISVNVHNTYHQKGWQCWFLCGAQGLLLLFKLTAKFNWIYGG